MAAYTQAELDAARVEIEAELRILDDTGRLTIARLQDVLNDTEGASPARRAILEGMAARTGLTLPAGVTLAQVRAWPAEIEARKAEAARSEAARAEAAGHPRWRPTPLGVLICVAFMAFATLMLLEFLSS